MSYPLLVEGTIYKHYDDDIKILTIFQVIEVDYKSRCFVCNTLEIEKEREEFLLEDLIVFDSQITYECKVVIDGETLDLFNIKRTLT